MSASLMGFGTIGYLTALVLRARGVKQVTVVEIAATRLASARKLGFSTIDPLEGPLAEQVGDRVRSEGPDVAFECVGSGQTIRDAIVITRNDDRTIIVGNALPVLELNGVMVQRGERSLIVS